MPRKTLSILTAGAALALPLTGCSDGGGTSSPSAANSSVTPSPSASTGTPSTTPSATTPAPKPSAAKPRTAAELSKALLTLADLPPGFAIEPDEGEGADVRLSSTRPACARLVALTNADRPPGSKAFADRAFSGGQDGPFVEETLDAMGSARAVAALQQTYRTAIRNCRSMTVTVPGQGRSTVSVREISAPPLGTNPVGVRFTATGGPLDGYEFSTVTTGVGDLVLGLTIEAGPPQDLDDATALALEKVRKVLGVTTTGT
jgi:hypothetical protein